MSTNTKKRIIKEAITDSLPILASYLFLGFGFGILMADKGYGPLWALAAAVLMLSGTLQYALAAMIGGGMGLIGVVATSIAIQFRHLFYGLTMLEKYKRQKGKIHRFELFYSLTDETFSLVCNKSAEKYIKFKSGKAEEVQEAKDFIDNQDTYYTWVSILNKCYWMIGCTLGCFIGESLPFSTEGIDFVMTAFFVCVFVEQWISTKNHIAALIGVFGSIICMLIFGSEDFMIPTMILMFVSLTLLRKKEGITNE